MVFSITVSLHDDDGNHTYDETFHLTAEREEQAKEAFYEYADIYLRDNYFKFISCHENGNKEISGDNEPLISSFPYVLLISTDID